MWETSKQCVHACCSRRHDGEHSIRMLRADDDDEASARRSRRQEAVRRAIERELPGEGLRCRTSKGEREAAVSSYVHVRVGSEPPVVQSTSRQSQDTKCYPPDPPPYPPGLRETSLETTGPQHPTGFTDASSSDTIPVPPPCPDPIRGARPDFQVQGYKGVTRSMRDASTQTSRERGLDFQELCELQVITTTGRGPGAMHLFPSCHTLRSSTGTHRRMFCRYCLQAARDNRGTQSSIPEG